MSGLRCLKASCRSPELSHSFIISLHCSDGQLCNRSCPGVGEGDIQVSNNCNMVFGAVELVSLEVEEEVGVAAVTGSLGAENVEGGVFIAE